MTIEISCLSMVMAVALGLLMALLRLYGVAPVRWGASAYLELIRGTPLLIQLLRLFKQALRH